MTAARVAAAFLALIGALGLWPSIQAGSTFGFAVATMFIGAAVLAWTRGVATPSPARARRG